ncbi:PEP-CTERM sorting domain-containing protein [Deinococcus sedimenti]|uniref:PEP-CTERM sorting domain-containing protein n=1 Tax=Deinococcus sedimenti TaxID=1867090 RepID=UPI003570A067
MDTPLLFIRIPFVALTDRNTSDLSTPRPEPASLLLALLGLNGFLSHSIGVRIRRRGGVARTRPRRRRTARR